MRISYWNIQVGPKSNTKCPCKRYKVEKFFKKKERKRTAVLRTIVKPPQGDARPKKGGLSY